MHKSLLCLAVAAALGASYPAVRAQDFDPDTVCISKSGSGPIRQHFRAQCRERVTTTEVFHIMMNAPFDGRVSNQVVAALPNGITFHLLCGNGGVETTMGWWLSSETIMPAIAKVGAEPAKTLEPFDLRPDPSADDNSGTGFGADDSSGDDRMTVISVPNMILRADDRTEMRITNGIVYLNTALADCTAKGTLTIIRP